ncbi:hypothetical protein [Sediminibacillus massiliensis]|uniref:hypothetical protein n=1 Tax=Sediminibacillus massiliensis TaxID=1926277 RepID=UPI00098894D1|nr:hypothetical protein [Sediminibacillus massiliensis]
MGLFSAISEWKEAKYRKRVKEMEEAGKCPDCRGRGYNTLVNDFIPATYHCTGCDGSGRFEDWNKA